MMTLEELRENSFPIPRYLDPSLPELEDGWMETAKLPKTTLTPPPKKMIAMDCEMVSAAALSYTVASDPWDIFNSTLAFL
jgi:RNA exonuclease 1